MEGTEQGQKETNEQLGAGQENSGESSTRIQPNGEKAVERGKDEGSVIKERPWSDSHIKTYQGCAKKEEFIYGRNLLPKSKKSTTLGFGTALHQCLMWLYRGDEARITGVVQAYVPRPGEELRTKEKLEAVVKKYKAEKMPPPWEKVLESEKELYFNAGRHRFVVIPDLVVQWRGGIYGVDHKHTTRFMDNFFRKFTRDSQIDAQMIAIREKYGSCNGIVVNGIVIRKGGPKSRLPEIDFMRDIAERTIEELENSRVYFDKWASQCESDREKLERRTNCFSYNEVCAYLGICSDRLSQQEIEQYYEVVPWKPREEEDEE